MADASRATSGTGPPRRRGPAGSAGSEASGGSRRRPLVSSRMPAANRDYWKNKSKANQERDADTAKHLGDPSQNPIHAKNGSPHPTRPPGPLIMASQTVPPGGPTLQILSSKWGIGADFRIFPGSCRATYRAALTHFTSCDPDQKVLTLLMGCSWRTPLPRWQRTTRQRPPTRGACHRDTRKPPFPLRR